jgi:hypothetical protein
MVDVFLSYPRKARAKVEPIKRGLESLGLDVFFDVQGIDGGDAFPDVIDRAVKSAKAVIGCWSEDAFKSKWCMSECRVGDMRGVLVPVAIERFTELTKPTDFVATNYIDLTDFQGFQPHEGWTRTLRSLSKFVERDLLRPAGATAPPPEQSAAAWNLIKDSLGPADYTEFQMHFPGAPEVVLASRHRRQLEAWEAIPRDNVESIANFKQGNLFEALGKRADETIATVGKSSASAANTAYWEAFDPIARALGVGHTTTALTRSTNYYHYFDSSKKWGICAYLLRSGNRIGAYVFDWQNQDAVFSELAKDRPAIEAEFRQPMFWTKGSIGTLLSPANADERTDWPRQHQWLADNMAALKGTMHERMAAARARASWARHSKSLEAR